jgi:hypothetical protein
MMEIQRRRKRLMHVLKRTGKKEIEKKKGEWKRTLGKFVKEFIMEEVV